MKSVEPTAMNITIPFKSREVGSLIFLRFESIQNLSDITSSPALPILSVPLVPIVSVPP